MKQKIYMGIRPIILLCCFALVAVPLLQSQDLNIPILPLEFWDAYANENEALAKAESGSPTEQRKAAITLFLLSRGEKNQRKALELVIESSKIINSLYRRKRNDLELALLSSEINMGVADKSSKIKDKISYTNRGLAGYEFALPNIPDNLEAKQIYLRTTIYIPAYFKNLKNEHWQQIQLFIDGYDAAMAKLESPEERKRLAELKTHVMIMAAHIAQRSRSTRKDAAKYLAQVDTSFFETMKAHNDDDLVEMYEELKK